MVDDLEDGETAARMRQLTKELRDLDLDYEREREELVSGAVSVSDMETCMPAIGAKRYDGAVALLASEPVSKEVVQERINSVQQAITSLRDERSRLGIGLDKADRVSQGISVRPQAEVDEQTSAQCKGDDDEQEHAGTDLRHAEASYLRYTVNSNFASMTRHHKEVAERMESVVTVRGGAGHRPSTSALLQGLDSLSDVTVAGRSHNNKLAVTTLLEGGHPEVAQELRRQKQEKEKRDRCLTARPISFPPSHTPGERHIAPAGGETAVDTRASAAAAAAAAVLESRRGRNGKLQDPSTILEGLSRYTPRGGSSCATKLASNHSDEAARWAYSGRPDKTSKETSADRTDGPVAALGGDPRSRAVTHGQVENSADTEWTCAAGGTEACLLAPSALQAPLGQSQSPRMAVTRNVEARAGDDVGEWLRTRETEMLREEQRTAARQAAARPPLSKIAEQHQSARVSSCNAPSAYAQIWDAMQNVDDRDMGRSRGKREADGADLSMGDAYSCRVDDKTCHPAQDKQNGKASVVARQSQNSAEPSASAASSKRGIWNVLRGFLGCSEPRQASAKGGAGGSNGVNVATGSTCWGQFHPQHDISLPRSLSSTHSRESEEPGPSHAHGGRRLVSVQGDADEPTGYTGGVSPCPPNQSQSLSVHLTHRLEGQVQEDLPALPKVVYVRENLSREVSGDDEVAWDVEAVIPIPPLDPVYGTTRDTAALEQVMAAVGEEASLALVKVSGAHVWLRGQPDQVQYGQDLVEAALHAA